MYNIYIIKALSAMYDVQKKTDHISLSFIQLFVLFISPKYYYTKGESGCVQSIYVRMYVNP